MELQIGDLIILINRLVPWNCTTVLNACEVNALCVALIQADEVIKIFLAAKKAVYVAAATRFEEAQTFRLHHGYVIVSSMQTANDLRPGQQIFVKVLSSRLKAHLNTDFDIEGC